MQYAQGSGFESGHYIYFANCDILSYTAYIAVYTFSISV